MNNFINPGLHLLVDFWEASNLTDLKVVESALIAASNCCGATILETKFHCFGEASGVTGVAILAESHISIHTWPELSYAAIDIFMCGSCDPYNALPVLRETFCPKSEQITSHFRGSKNLNII